MAPSFSVEEGCLVGELPSPSTSPILRHGHNPPSGIHPHNAVSIKRTASRLCRKRTRQDNARSESTENRKKGLRFKLNGRSRSLQRGTVPSINDTGSLQLIGFRAIQRSNSNLLHRSHSCKETELLRQRPHKRQDDITGQTHEEMDSQDSFRKLVKETQDLFRTGGMMNDGSPPFSRTGSMAKFVEEASDKCKGSSKEEFADFMDRNKDSFNRLLESRFYPKRSLNVDRDSGVFTEQEIQTCSASSSTRSSFHHQQQSSSQQQMKLVKSSSHDSSSTQEAHAQTMSRVSTVHRTESQIRTSGTHPEFKTIIELNGDNNKPSDYHTRPENVNLAASSEPQLRAAIFKRPLSEFPRFSPVSPTEGAHLNRMSTGFDASMSASYHFSTSRSRFQYCGETNTFKFSTEHVSQSSYSEQGYESVSESEDEESVDVDSSSETSSQLNADHRSEISSSTNASRSDSCTTLNALELHQKTAHNLREIAYELLTTERTYVCILNLLDQVFHFRVDQENRSSPMFSQEVITQMFSNLKSLYKLHNDFVLPKLEERLQNWDSNPRIGDLMRELAPFLKMYTEYVKNYDNGMHLISTWYQKQPRFAAIMDYVHRLPECGKLQISHHMLTPVQRIPRYELLLKEYLKKLPEDSPDRDDTEKALELVSTAAHHANEAMKKIHKFKKLLEIQELVGGVMDLVSPSRELLKDGKIIKISARSSDHQERYLFVFNDLILLCSQRLISQRVVSGPLYRVRARLEMDGLIVEEGDNLETPNSFYIRNTGRSIELCTSNSNEKMTWMQVLAKAVHDLAQKKSSLKVANEENGLKSPDSSELGLLAPRLVKSESVSHCMNCATPFSAFGRWKHHCHACGIVACRKCLSNKMRLCYDTSKLLRVCDRCHKVLLHHSHLNHTNEDNIEKSCLASPPESPVLTHQEKAVISGYLKLRTNGRSTWSKRWFALQPDFVLYSYKSQEDKLPLTSTPVPGFLVSLLEKGDAVDPKTPFAFKLFHVKKTYYFQAADGDEQKRWTTALDQASRAEDLV